MSPVIAPPSDRAVGRCPSVYFIDRDVGEVVRPQAPAKPQLEAPDAEIRPTYKTVGADSREPDLIFEHVEFAGSGCVDSAKSTPRSAIDSPSAAALAPGLRAYRIERKQVTLRLACCLPHTPAFRRGEKDERALPRLSTLSEKAFCCQSRAMWPIDSASRCAYLRGSVLSGSEVGCF
jgi:hypothetical protein